MNEEQGQQHSQREPPATRLSVALDILFSDADREIGPPPDLQHCLGPIDNLLAEAQALPSGVRLLETTLRHRFRFIARMFLNAGPAGRLARLMHLTGAVITGTPALAFMNPSVLVQLSARALTGGTGVDNTIAAAILRLSLHPIVRKNFDEPFPVENAAFTHLCYRAASLLPFFDDLPLDPRPNQHIFTTLPICLRESDIPRFLHLFIRDGYVEILEGCLDLIHKIPDGHLIDVEFSDIRILRHAERQTYVLLLASHSGSATCLLFRSHCTADHIFYNDTFAYCAYPQTTLRSQAITTKPLTNLQTRELLRLGFTIHNDFSAWQNHDCSTLPHCPQRRRDILDGDNFFFRFRPSADPQYDIKRLASGVLPMWRLGGDPCFEGGRFFPKQLWWCWNATHTFIVFEPPAQPLAIDVNADQHQEPAEGPDNGNEHEHPVPPIHAHDHVEDLDDAQPVHAHEHVEQFDDAPIAEEDDEVQIVPNFVDIFADFPQQDLPL